VLRAKVGLFAIAQGLNVSGQADGVVPLFRYEHLRDRAKELIAYIQGIESRMFPIQFELDDFAEAISAIKRPLDAQQAELVAVNQRITELTQTLAELTQAEQALDGVVIALDKAQADCDCDWFCWLVAFICDAFISAVIIAVAIAIATTTAGIGAIIVAEALLVVGIGAGMGTAYLVASTFSCDNVGVIERSMKASLDGVRASIADDEAELQHALATRDPDRQHQCAHAGARRGLSEQRRARARRQDARCHPGPVQPASAVPDHARPGGGKARAKRLQFRARCRGGPYPRRLLRSGSQGLHRRRNPAA
jgi:hypothetical protein